MEHLRAQLEAVRERARRWLVLGWFALFLRVAIPVVLVAVVIDYALRLPGGVRLFLLAVAVVLSGMWLVPRLRRAWGYAPRPVDLALRLEAMHPEVAGRLAAGLEGVDTGLTEAELASVRPDRLIDAAGVRKVITWAAGLLGMVVVLSVWSPAAAWTASQRWALPLGDAEWPKRVRIVEQTASGDVVAADAPIELAAVVERGATPSLRVWVDGVVGEEPVSALMTPQVASAASDERRYAASIQPPAGVVSALQAGRLDEASFTYTLAAGDDQTERRTVRLIARPELRRATAFVTPPAYAGGGLDADTGVELVVDGDARRPLSVLAGSRVQLRFDLNRPIAPAAIRDAVSGLPEGAAWSAFPADTETTARAEVSFELNTSADLTVALADASGLRAAVDPVIRLLAEPDRPPTAVVLDPAADRSVLPTAVVAFEVEGIDDLAVTSVRAVATVEGAVEGAGVEGGNDASAEPVGMDTWVELAAWSEAAANADAEADAEAVSGRALTGELRPALLSAAAGQTVLLVAEASDAFPGRAPVRSVARRLRVITESELLASLRAELSAAGRIAERAVERQAAASEPGATPPRRLRAQERVASASADIAERIASVGAALGTNRVTDSALTELVDRVTAEAATASAAASSAVERLRSGAEAAAEQAEATASLTALADLLREGGDALGLRLALEAVLSDQEAVARATRALLPELAGRSVDELDEAARAELEALRQKQAEVGERAAAAERGLRSEAEALAEQAGADPSSVSDADRAAAVSMGEAASRAAEGGLAGLMEQSEAALSENQMAAAARRQEAAAEVLRDMLSELGRQAERRQEMLRRRVAALMEQVRGLIESELALVAATGEALAAAAGEAEPSDGELPLPVGTGLASRQEAVWRRSLSAEETAAGETATLAVAEILRAASDRMAESMPALREGAGVAGRLAQTRAVERLEAALAELEEQAEAAGGESPEALRELYAALAARQSALADTVADAVKRAAGGLPRPVRATLREAATAQAAVADGLAELDDRVSGKAAFERAHRRLTEQIGTAAEQLRSGTTRGGIDETVALQRRIAAAFERLAEALQGDRSDNDFAENGGGGGGAGGGGSGAADGIPDAAELKLLRFEQIALRERLSAVAGDTRVLTALASEQAELRDLAERLIRKTERAMEVGE